MKKSSIFFNVNYRMQIAFLLLTIIYLLITNNCYSQGIAINTTGVAADNSAMLDISSTNQGILIPRMTTVQRSAIPSPAIGLLIFNTTTNRFNYFKVTGWYELIATPLSTNNGSVNPGGGTAINTNGSSADPSAILDVSSDTRGLLIPRTTPTSITLPVNGLIIFDNVANNYKYYNGSEWKTICESFISATTGSGSLTSQGTAFNTTGNDADNSAMLDISSETQGLLIPRMGETERNLILPKQGLMVYENNSTNTIDFSDGSNWYYLATTCIESCPGFPTVTDVDGNVYNTLVIGTQCWFKENLRVTNYNDGSTSIANVTNGGAWIGLKTAAYCWYNNDAATYKILYGALYNWYAASSPKLCPTGWRVPSDNDFTTLERAVCSSSTCTTDFPFGTLVGYRGTDEGGKLKEEGTTNWISPNIGATNSSGFTALPAGNRIWGGGQYQQLNKYAYFWSSTKETGTPDIAWYRILGFDDARSYRYTILSTNGCSVRCVRDL